jgi:hypothetical protein
LQYTVKRTNIEVTSVNISTKAFRPHSTIANQQYAFIDEEIERQRKWKLQSSQQIIEHQLKDSNDSSRTREINRRWKAIFLPYCFCLFLGNLTWFDHLVIAVFQPFFWNLFAIGLSNIS